MEKYFNKQKLIQISLDEKFIRYTFAHFIINKIKKYLGFLLINFS